MINDLDSTLRALLKRDLPRALAQQVTISFDPPDDQFPPTSVTLPAIDLFLYDLRENHDLRSNEWSLEPANGSSVVRRPPPVRVDCSYMVTAWPSKGVLPSPAEDEHRLLGEVMAVLLRYPTLPPDMLQGRLDAQALPPPTAVLQPGHLQSLGEFWQAMGGKPKAALHYTVTVAVDVAAGESVPVVLEKQIGAQQTDRPAG